MNECTLIGNVGKDPEIRFTQQGEPIANFSLATSETWKDKAGQKQEKTQWHRVAVFGPAAKFVRDYVKKGTKLLVRGSIDYQEYEKDGVKKYSTQIKVSGFKTFIEFAGPKPKDDAQSGGTGAEVPFQATDDDVPF